MGGEQQREGFSQQLSSLGGISLRCRDAQMGGAFPLLSRGCLLNQELW